MILFFDTETTGLCPGHIIQLSYILDYGNKAIGKNFYFAVDSIEPSATMVHGYTVESILELSHGETFGDHADEIFEDFSSASLLVAHNFKFDFSFMLAEFGYIGRQFRYHESFDTMRFFTPVLKLPRKSSDAYKFPKLSELCNYFDVTSEKVADAVSDIFFDDIFRLHEARFDTTAMYLCAKKGEEQIDELSNLFSFHRKNMLKPL